MALDFSLNETNSQFDFNVFRTMYVLLEILTKSRLCSVELKVNGFPKGCHESVCKVQACRRRLRIVDVEKVPGGYVGQDNNALVDYALFCNSKANVSG